MFDIYREFFIGLFIALNPVANITCYLTFTSHLNKAEKKSFIFRAVTTVLIGVILTIIFGQLILEAFGISIGAFRIAAGIALLLIGLKMMREGPEKPNLDGIAGTSLEIVPFAIPIMLGPATLGFITAFTEKAPGFWDEIIFLGLGFISVGSQAVILLFSENLTKVMGDKGMDVATRIMGLILMGIGMEGMVRGMLKVFPGFGG